MADINKIIEDIEKKLDRVLAGEAKAIENAIKKSERKVLEKLAALNIDGSIKARSSLSRAAVYHTQITKTISAEYGTAYDNYVKNLNAITGLAKEEYKRLGIGLTFSDVDRDTFKSLRIAVNAEFAALGDYITSEIAKPLYDNVLVGGSFSSLAAEVEKLLFDKSDGKLAIYARRKVHDTLMGYYQSNHLLAARRTGIQHFLYFGNIIAKTRPFCRKRAGAVFHLKEIAAWNGMKWKGKKPGNVFINRGGYNCRHTFHPVRKRWIKEGRIEVQAEAPNP